jgi:c(7)-type cytochrome triheme protein
MADTEAVRYQYKCGKTGCLEKMSPNSTFASRLFLDYSMLRRRRKMIQNTIKLMGAMLLAVSLLLASPLVSSSFSAETSGAAALAVKGDTHKFLYDEHTRKNYGPKADIVWAKPTEVTFSHVVHTKDAELSCTSCHKGLFRMKAGEVLTSGKMTMAAMAEGKYCGTCHDGSTAFSTDTQCASCHTKVEELLPPDPIVWTKPVKAVLFYHKPHTEDYGLACDECHDSLFAMKKGAAEKAADFTMKSLYEGKYCGKCHDGSTAFASDTRCNTCHIGVKGYNRLFGNSASHDTKSQKDTHAGK